jgi:hypothetical protein
MRRDSFHHRQRARLHNRFPAFHSPQAAERRLDSSYSWPGPTGATTSASFERAFVCYKLYGGIMIKFAPDKKLFSARTGGGQRCNENRSVTCSLTLSNTRGPFRSVEIALPRRV